MGNQPAHLGGDVFGLGQHGARLGSGHERPVSTVSPIGEGFRGKRVAERTGGPSHGGTRATHHPQLRIEHPNGGDDGSRQRLVMLGLVIERAVRFDVMQRYAIRPGDRVERAQLIEQQVGQFGRTQLNRAPAESLPVIEPGMGANGDAMLHRQRHGLSHRM